MLPGANRACGSACPCPLTLTAAPVKSSFCSEDPIPGADATSFSKPTLTPTRRRLPITESPDKRPVAGNQIALSHWTTGAWTDTRSEPPGPRTAQGGVCPAAPADVPDQSAVHLVPPAVSEAELWRAEPEPQPPGEVVSGQVSSLSEGGGARSPRAPLWAHQQTIPTA